MICEGEVHFVGPVDRRGRKAWEELKAAIRVAAGLHEINRAQYHHTNSEPVLQDLRAIEKTRRRLMRKVPKGWNWREEIYSQDSLLSLAKDMVVKMQEAGYVPLTADD